MVATTSDELSKKLTDALEVVCVRRQRELTASLFHQNTMPDGSPFVQFCRAASGYLLRFPGLADFQVSKDGLTIQCWPAPGITEETVQNLYLNQVLPLALSKRRKLVFHASTVEINGAGTAFIGLSGRGKSTLAVSFATHGFRLITDDGLVLYEEDDEYFILPGHPSIRLWEDSLEALIGKDAETAAPVQYTTKTRLMAKGKIEYCNQARRLSQVFFLGEEAICTTITEISARDALIELVKHSFLLDIEEKDLISSQFEELSRLTSLISFYRLEYPRRYRDLGTIRRRILEKVSGQPH